MSVTPLRGQCANCGADEQLSRIAEGDGACPFCHLPFCDDGERCNHDVRNGDSSRRPVDRTSVSSDLSSVH